MVFGFPGRNNRRLTVDLSVVVLPLVAVAHWIRGAPTDAVIFVVVTLLLVVTELRVDGALADHPLRFPWFVVVAVGLCVLAFGRDSLPVGVVISVIGGLVLFTELREPSLPVDRPVPRRSWVWAAVGLSWLAWEFVAFVYEQAAGGESVDHPTMSDLIEPMLSSRVVQAVAITAWLTAGLAMLRAAAVARRS